MTEHAAEFPSPDPGHAGPTAGDANMPGSGGPGEPPRPETSQTLRLVLLTAAALLAYWRLGGWGIVVIAGLFIMITLHELGHYIMAKRSGMKVTEFFLGFGPRIWSFRRGETEYGLKAIPLGAYVRIIGMSSAEEVPPEDEHRTYRSKPFWQRFGVAVAGSTMHGIQALVLVFVLLAFAGMPGGTVLKPASEGSPSWTVRALVPDCPAERAGLQPGDRLLTVDGQPMEDWDVLTAYVGEHPGKTVTVTLERDGKTLERSLRLAVRKSGGVTIGTLGVSPQFEQPPTERVGVLAAIPQTFDEVGATLGASLQGLGHFARPSTIKEFARQVANASSDRAEADRESAPTTTVAAPPTSSPASTPGTTTPPTNGDTTSEDRACAASMAAGGSSGDSADPSARLTSIIGIFQLGRSFGQSDGLRSVLALLAAINIFIGVFNLLPFPILDGGHVVVAVYEKVQEWRLGLKTRYLADITRALPVVYGFLFLLGLLAISTIYLDIVNPVAK